MHSTQKEWLYVSTTHTANLFDVSHTCRMFRYEPPETCTTTTTTATALSARELAIFREGLRLARCCASTTIGQHYQQQREAVDETVERDKEAEPIRTPITAAATRPPPTVPSRRACFPTYNILYSYLPSNKTATKKNSMLY